MANEKNMYIYAIDPIDNFTGATSCGWSETLWILNLMPDEPRDKEVYKTWIVVPGFDFLFLVYLCKGENNGTTYVFSTNEIPYWEEYLMEE